MNRRGKIIAAIDKMRAVPVGAMEAVRLLHAQDVEVARVVAVIERDPGWTANLLRLANSSYFGFRRSVDTVHSAFLRLGSRNIFQLIVASAVVPILKGATKNRDNQAIPLWRHSMGVAAAVEKMAAYAGIEASAAAVTGAIIHDIGEMVLLQNMPQEMDAARDLARDGQISPLHAERMLLDIDHAEAGAMLLERWHLPEEIILMVRYHHELSIPDNVSMAVHLVHLADMAAWVAEHRMIREEQFQDLFLAAINARFSLDRQVAISITDEVEAMHAQAENLPIEPAK